MTLEFDHFFDPVHQEEIFILVDVTHISSVHPLLAVIVEVECFGRCLRIIKIANHVGWSADQDLSSLNRNVLLIKAVYRISHIGK